MSIKKEEEFQDPAELQKYLVLSWVLERAPEKTGGRESLSSEDQLRGDTAKRPLKQCCAEPGRSVSNQIQTRAVAGRSILHRA